MTLGEAIAYLHRWRHSLRKTSRRSNHMIAIDAILRHFGD
jgi:hypothetical protein